MAEFCKQCAEDMGFDPPGDFAGMAPVGYICYVLCEDCGSTYVDHEGTCINPVCDKQHGPPRQDAA